MMNKHQYLDALRKDIVGGAFGDEKRLPSFRRLAERYDCSIASIKLAVDQLQVEGILETIHGKGTFFTDKGLVPLPRQERKRIIGAILLQNGWLETMERLKMHYQRQGWFLSIYDACADMQDPVKEREFLDMALHEGFTGMLMVATPLAPVNTEFFHEMRQKGMKVCHLAYYQEDMANENCVLLDYAAAVDLVVQRAEREGLKRIVPVRGGSQAPTLKVLEKRVADIHSKVEILPTFRFMQGMSEWKPEKDHLPENQYWDMAQKELEPLLDTTPDTLLMPYRAEVGAWINRLFSEYDIPLAQRPKVWALDALTPANRGVEAVRYDLTSQIETAMEYLCDSSIDPLCCQRKLIQPQGFGWENLLPEEEKKQSERVEVMYQKIG